MSRKIDRTTASEQRRDARKMTTSEIVRYIATAVKYSDTQRGMCAAVEAELDERLPGPKVGRRKGPCGTGSRPPKCMGSANYGPGGCTCPR